MVASGLRALRRLTPRERITLALAMSLLLHAAVYGGWQLGRKMGWTELPLPKWMQALSITKLLTPKPLDLEKLKLLQPPDPPREREVQLTFVDVDPALAVLEPPKIAKYYSSASTRAANPVPKIESNNPQIEGTQTRIVKTVEATKPVPQPEPKPPVPKPEPEPKKEPTPPQPPQPQPLQPSPAPKPPVQVAEARPKPKPADPVGDLAVVKPAPESKLSPPAADASKGAAEAPQPAPRTRPMTLAEARARAENISIAGERMKQDGGVRNIGHVALDVRSSLTGAYDAALIAAVQKRWYDLLSDRATPRGKAVVHFRLHFDGRVTDVKMAECDVGELFGLFCQKAIVDPAPYARWPSDMRRQLEADYRDVKFTFYYN